jgi:hypothetical protein
MAFLRMKQPAVTNINPHQGNKSFFIPNRYKLGKGYTREWQLHFGGDTLITTTALIDPTKAGSIVFTASADFADAVRVAVGAGANFMAGDRGVNADSIFRIFESANQTADFVSIPTGDLLEWGVRWTGVASSATATVELAGDAVANKTQGADLIPVTFLIGNRVGGVGWIGIIQDVTHSVEGQVVNRWRVDDNSNDITDDIGGADGSLSIGTGFWAVPAAILLTASFLLGTIDEPATASFDVGTIDSPTLGSF